MSTVSGKSTERSGDGRTHPVALLRLGFRPFYLLAGIYAAISIPAWTGMYFGLLPMPVLFPPGWWHAHEMIFGYTAAVITGFLFTAVPNWSGRPTPTGVPLALLAVLWIAGRVLINLDIVPVTITVIVDCAFLFLAAGALFVPIIGARNYRNYGVIAVVLAMACANLGLHLSYMKVISYPPDLTLSLGLNAIILIMVIIGGRVIPFFTANVLQGIEIRRGTISDILAIISVVLLLIASAVPLLRSLVPELSIIASILNGWRMRSWRFAMIRQRPILWILHLGYAWIVLGLLLAGLAAWVPAMPRSAFIHAITVGAVGSLTLGMMTRTALGHSGRPLELARPVVWSYYLISIAAVARILGTIVPANLFKVTIIISVITWSTAFLIFLYVYWPILTRPRADGKPG